MYKVSIGRAARRDMRHESQSAVRHHIDSILEILARDPFQSPPRYEKLSEDVDLYSRRVNVQHRIVYKVDKGLQKIQVLSVKSHYE